eukprot:UN04886
MIRFKYSYMKKRATFTSFRCLDGGTMGVYWLNDNLQKTQDDTPVVVLLHGLTGNGCDNNNLWISSLLTEKGYHR